MDGTDETWVEHLKVGPVGVTMTFTVPNFESPPSVARDWPMSAPDPTGPVSPPESALAVAPDLTKVLQTVPEPTLPGQVRHDWPVTASPTELHLDQRDEWTAADTALVQRSLADDVDRYIVALIERWGGLWPHLTEKQQFRDRFPRFAAELLDRHDGDPRFSRKREAHRLRWIQKACSVGLWDIYRLTNPWPDPVAKVCVVCGRFFAPEGLVGSELGFGPPIACKACCRRAMSGHQEVDVDVPALLRTFGDLLGFPPPGNFRENRELVAVSANRAELLALLVAMPDQATCSTVLGLSAGPGRWLATLQRVGLIGESQRLSRGVVSFAEDGHLCRSMGELAIERFLIANDITHTCEPKYPRHDALNPNGTKRADWLLEGDLWVEYGGMLDDGAYAKRMADKRELAEACGLQLLVLTPEDLPRLTDALRDLL